MPKITDFDILLEMLADERSLKRAGVSSRLLSRKVWIAEWHLPGCLSESQSICRTKQDAIECALSMAECEDGPPRGMTTALRKYGRFDSNSPMFGRCINTVSQCTIADLI